MEDRGLYVWVPLQDWLGRSDNPRGAIATPFDYLVKHYTPGQEATSYNDAVRLLRNIWNFHTYSAEGSGWGWIGYNTIQYGRYIFEGAGIGNRGIHAPGANGISHGHAFLVSTRTVTDEEWMALRAFLKDIIADGYMTPKVLTQPAYNTNHQDWVSTGCPGPVVLTANRFYLPLEGTTEVASPTRNRMDLAKVDKEGKVFHQAMINGKWTGWAHLGGIVTDGPIQMAWHGSYLHFFAIERESGRLMQLSFLENVGWVFSGAWYPVDTTSGNKSVAVVVS